MSKKFEEMTTGINESAFLLTTASEMARRGWSELDVILISGDSYIDSPYMGTAVIGRILENAGWRVGVIAQPDIQSGGDITRLGEPRLFWGVSGGSVDSMVSNYTASNKKRRQDDYTPGGVNNRRPDRAVIAYSNLIRRYFKHTRPIVLGGMEASLRRVAHYDYWSDSVRRSILFDAKADFLLYGMCEKSVLDLARVLHDGKDPLNIKGLGYIGKQAPEEYLEIPSYETVAQDKNALIDMFHMFYTNNDPLTARGLYQKHGDRLLVQNPPADFLSQEEMDAVYGLPFQRAQHPYYERQGGVRALETIQFSINTHRGCYGECNFCSIAVHEGRTVRWRSAESILDEAQKLTRMPNFKGYIQDLGGPTANMYGFECRKKLSSGACPDQRCLFPEICPALKPDHSKQVELLQRIRQLPGVKKVFVSSGIRYDMVLADREHGQEYLKEIVGHHVSGQLKIAPEHSQPAVLEKMGKSGPRDLIEFKSSFDRLSAGAGKRQFLTYYLIAAHPGCTEADMHQLKKFASQELKISPEQVQIFTPLPSTYSALMYHTGLDPFTRQPIFVEKDLRRKQHQKDLVVGKESGKKARSKKLYRKAG